MIQTLQPQYAWDGAFSLENGEYCIDIMQMPGVAAHFVTRFSKGATIADIEDFLRKSMFFINHSHRPWANIQDVGGKRLVSACGYTSVYITCDGRASGGGLMPLADFHQPYTNEEIVEILKAFRNFSLYLIMLLGRKYAVRFFRPTWTPLDLCNEPIILTNPKVTA